MERDPITLFEAVLTERGVTPAELTAIRAEVEAEMAAVAERIRAWPDPAPESRFEDVFA
jgi:TPP-dependent pyruvate/acetoin dehydrogenase alpha subunit